MKLKNILDGIDIIRIDNYKNYNISSVTHISNDIESNGMFIAIDGNNYDGNNYIKEVVLKGAKCIVTSNNNIVVSNVCIVVVKDIRIAMSIIAKNFYNRCCDKLKIIGIVGTAGKTSTSLILSQILKYSGKKIAVIGTNGIYIDNIRQENKFTTPDPLELHYLFYQMKLLSIDIVIMEVSAQAIYYNKVYGINFDICIFTNISREHLDFFGAMENYARCKMDFFNSKNMKECVVNIDDFYGRELAYKVNIPCVSYGIDAPANSFAIDINLGFDNTTFVANIIDDVFLINCPFVGRYNVSNILASLTVAKMLGMGELEIVSAIDNLKEIDGRYNVVDVGNKKIIIDFAHTAKSIDELLKHITSTSDYNIISVFGCVGYSDKDKREEMSAVVAKYSRLAIVTTDNRGQTPFEEIANDIVNGLGDCPYTCIEDRSMAIKYGYDNMLDNDILVLIGKGAENFQNINGVRIPYSDREVVESLIS